MNNPLVRTLLVIALILVILALLGLDRVYIHIGN